MKTHNYIILISIFFLIFSTSCFKKLEKIDVDISEEAIFLYKTKIVYGSCYADESNFIFLTYDSKNIYLSKITKFGEYFNIISISNFLTNGYTYDSINSLELFELSDKSKIISYKDDTIYLKLIKLNYQNQFEWKKNIKISNNEHYEFINIAQNTNQNIVFNYFRRGSPHQQIKPPPPQNMTFDFKQEEYNSTTCEFVDSTSYKFNNINYMTCFSIENEGTFLITGQQDFENQLFSYYNNINISKIDNNTIQTLNTNITINNNFYYSYNKIVKINNNYYAIYTDNNLNNNLLIFNMTQIIDNKIIDYSDYKILKKNNSFYLLSFYSIVLNYYPILRIYDYNNDTICSKKFDILNSEIIDLIENNDSLILFGSKAITDTSYILFTLKTDNSGNLK